ncbi:MAG: L,D-transpeptidase family protein [Anaerolineales bacterium]|nr:L,D-transpeptidase family protein [Anaerolineales bacterium]
MNSVGTKVKGISVIGKLIPLAVCSIFCVLLFFPSQCFSWYPRLQTASRLPEFWTGMVVGSNKPFIVGSDDTLVGIARRGRLGYQGLIAANPGVDPWHPGRGRELLLPYAAILPFGVQKGITVNLAEFRLYLVWEDRGQLRVRIYPIGLGRDGWSTPEGNFRITTIIDNPLWTIPVSLREESPEQSVIVSPGPENPLGSHWIGLSVEGYGIHGTNRPYGIGRQISHGCIRLYPRDIVDLVGKVEKGVPVRIIYQPIKVGRRADTLYVEIHADYLSRLDDPLGEIKQQARAMKWQQPLDKKMLERIVREARGIPLEAGAWE